MGVGDVTISGAYAIDDTTGIDGFVTAYTSAGGGNSVFTYSAGDNKIFVGCVKGI